MQIKNSESTEKVFEKVFGQISAELGLERKDVAGVYNPKHLPESELAFAIANELFLLALAKRMGKYAKENGIKEGELSDGFKRIANATATVIATFEYNERYIRKATFPNEQTRVEIDLLYWLKKEIDEKAKKLNELNNAGIMQQLKSLIRNRKTNKEIEKIAEFFFNEIIPVYIMTNILEKENEFTLTKTLERTEKLAELDLGGTLDSYLEKEGLKEILYTRNPIGVALQIGAEVTFSLADKAKQLENTSEKYGPPEYM
ncbi:MAG: hypothetical protein ACP5TJ_03230 [Candidatus Micrarchaeia archaeon]